MNAAEKRRLELKVRELEARLAKLEGLLLRAGVRIGETEHGDVVWSVGQTTGGSSRMAEALLGKTT